MAKTRGAGKTNGQSSIKGITRVTVCGYKSISHEQSIDIRPLTILAGANSSGKSSMMQPLLLMKQTLEASYDPGPLLLDGPNVRFTSVDQLLSRRAKDECGRGFYFGIQSEGSFSLTIHLAISGNHRLTTPQMDLESPTQKIVLRSDMEHEEISSMLPSYLADLSNIFSRDKGTLYQWVVVRNRCFLELTFQDKKGKSIFPPGVAVLPEMQNEEIERYVSELVHLPGLRGNPARTYPLTAVGPTFPGTFENYAATVIARWQEDRNTGKLDQLSRDLERLNLTWKVSAKPINDTQVEIKVGRLPHCAKGGSRDMVSIADVGFGVSQTLPVLVALLVAKPGQMVYLEQPEIHLHPRAQFALAQVLADAARRGVRVVVETHSSLVLLGVQALVAGNELSPSLVKLHWFRRDDDGSTEVRSADLDDAGAFGDWPEDFDDVVLDAQSRYLDAAESRIQGV